jgi:putative two-component system response regulator
MKPYLSGTKTKDLVDLVRRMAAIAEYREPDIMQHLERIRGYCQVMANGMGLPSQESEAIGIASMLHDVGKAGLPDSILTNSGDLSPYEWDLMKRHTIMGAEILKDAQLPILQAGEVIALTHHERWDGSGYPYKLKGEDIPVSGRIVALADVFDALTTRRLYKKEITVECAYELIEESAGVLFDPELVNVFINNFSEILKTRKLGAGKTILN